MAHSAEGTTFGIFGHWGSGKTSATKALQRDVLRAARVPLQESDTLAVAYVDCSGLHSSSAADVSSFVHGKLAHSGVVQRNSVLEKGVFTFFRKALQVAKVAAPDPVSKAGITIVEGLT